ncbi:MAG: trehalose-phosphatase [Acidimicrobiia bacterium]|nr:trehalose-phosphatase [Acidimicrobiia bacterium]
MGSGLSGHAGGLLIDTDLRSALDRVAALSPLLVASDYDGVLSPIVPDPAAAVPDQAALAALRRLGELPATHAVAVSGRSLAALTSFVGETDEITLVGTHGAEESGLEVSGDLRNRVRELQSTLGAVARQHPGAAVEEKPIGAAFHYRHVTRPAEAAAAARAVAEASGARTISGKMVVECLFGDANKGDAIRRFVGRLSAAATVYLGDDTTDEDAFAVLGEADVGIKVGYGDTRAAYTVAGQPDVAGVLEYLLERRTS